MGFLAVLGCEVCGFGFGPPTPRFKAWLRRVKVWGLGANNYGKPLTEFSLPCFLRKLLLKIRAFRPQPFIPKGEVQTKIIAVIAVVMAMMGSADEPFPDGMVQKPAGVNLDIEVIHHAGEGHDGQVGYNGIKVHGNDHQDQRKDEAFQQTFNRVKGKSRPGRWDPAIVVNFVNKRVYFGVVHPAVQPVITSFVDEHRYSDAAKKPDPAVRPDIVVQSKPSFLPGHGGTRANNGKNQPGHHRPSDLRSQLAAGIRFLSDLAPRPFVGFPSIKIKMKHPGDQQIAGHHHGKYGCRSCCEQERIGKVNWRHPNQKDKNRDNQPELLIKIILEAYKNQYQPPEPALNLRRRNLSFPLKYGP